jgi:hypothetical protein
MVLLVGPNLDILIFGPGCLFVISLMLKLAKLSLLKSITLGVLFSDIIVTLIHPFSFQNGEIVSQDGDVVLFLYYGGSVIYLVIFVVILGYKNRTNNCIIPCCRPKVHFYDAIPDEPIST